MSIIRSDTGEIRLIWRLIIIILLFVLVSVLIRLIPIGISTAILVNDGMTHANALEKANSIILEDLNWSTVIGVVSGLIGVLIVWFMLRVTEKSRFTWEKVGLDWRSNSLLTILLGAVLAVFLFISSIVVGFIINSNAFSLNGLITGISIPIFLQNFVLYLAMGFGEEIVFRGYVQTRLVERFRAIWGIPLAAVIFVLLHQISYSLSPVIIVSGVMIWTAIGTLYYVSKSLYLVVIFHGMANTLTNALHFEVGDLSTLVVNALALLLVIVFILVRPRISGMRSYPA